MQASYTGLDELIAKLKSLKQSFNRFAVDLAKERLAETEKVWEKYPPQPDRMRSGHFNTYVRGIGHVPKSAIIQSAGNIKTMDMTGARLTSEQMNTKFFSSVTSEQDAVTGSLINTASYAGWVIGPVSGDPHQVSFHAATGWVDADKAEAVAMDGVDEAVDEFINSFFGEV